MKNLYLLKRSPSSNLRTLLLGPTSSNRRDVNELMKKPPTSFIFLSFFFLSFLFFLFSLSFLLSISLISSLSLFLSCLSLLLQTHLFIQNFTFMQVDTWLSMCLVKTCILTHGLPCVTHMVMCHPIPDASKNVKFWEFNEIRLSN